MSRLEGKAVVITGSGRGIGAACAHGVARRGAAVVVNDVDQEVAEETAKAIVAEGGRAIAHVADIVQSDQAQGLIDRCVAEFGAIDGLVNNAGVSPRGDLVDLDEAALRRTLEINVVGLGLCSAAAARHMLPRGRGSIVNILSGAQCGIANLGIYAASKGAVAGFTYSWALELQGSGVRVNGFAPTSTATRMMDDYISTGGGPGIIVQPVAPEVNAPPIEYLLSDESSAINGQVLRFDGKRVTIMSHPAIVMPWIDVAEPTLEGIAAIFRNDIGARQMPLGIVGVRVTAA